MRYSSTIRPFTALDGRPDRGFGVGHANEAVEGGAAREKSSDVTEADARGALMQLDPLWDELFPSEQARILGLMVERVDIEEAGIKVRLRVDGLTNLAREMRVNIAEAAE